jgi:eukaryotic-like serine/threonine-protein kinase
MVNRDLAQVPAANLDGLNLQNGWTVTAALPKKSSSGGTFSFFYNAKNGTREGFVKAIDFTEAFEPGTETIRALANLTAAFELERDIVFLCANERLSKVVVGIDHGSVQVPGFEPMMGKVYYIIFERADGDVRGQADITNRLDTYWCLQAVRDVCLGLEQVHRFQIAHQDPKPSNVLFYKDKTFRITDFGRAAMKGRSVYHDNYNIPGDGTYAPPELLYNSIHPDFTVRRNGCDLYMLGNLAAFMFSGANVTANIFSRLGEEFYWFKWQGSYDQVLPYLQQAFNEALEDLAKATDAAVREPVVSMIRELCNPDLSRRGHPRGIGTPQQYSLIRYTSQLTNLCKRYEIELRVKRKKAG